MSSRPRDLTGYILGDFKGSVDAKGLLRTIFGRRVEGVESLGDLQLDGKQQK